MDIPTISKNKSAFNEYHKKCRFENMSTFARLGSTGGAQVNEKNETEIEVNLINDA